MDHCNAAPVPCGFCKGTAHVSLHCPQAKWRLVDAVDCPQQRVPVSADFPAPATRSAARSTVSSGAGAWHQPSAMEKKLDDISSRLSALELKKEEKSQPSAADPIAVVLSAIRSLDASVSKRLDLLDLRFAAHDRDLYSLRESLLGWSSQLSNSLPGLPSFELKDVPYRPVPAPSATQVSSVPVSASAVSVSPASVPLSSFLPTSVAAVPHRDHSSSPATVTPASSLSADQQQPMTAAALAHLQEQPSSTSPASDNPSLALDSDADSAGPSTPKGLRQTQPTHESPEKAPVVKRARPATGQAHTHVSASPPARDDLQRKRRARDSMDSLPDDLAAVSVPGPVSTPESLPQLQTSRISSEPAIQPHKRSLLSGVTSAFRDFVNRQ